MQFKREKVGAPPQGGGGSYPTPTPRPPKKSIRIEGLPEGHNKVATYAHGGGKPIKVNSGSFNGWLVGGGKRSEVRGKTFHPQTPVPNTLRWGFWPIVIYLEANIADQALLAFNKSLPQSATRPGGQLVEMKITSINSTGSWPNPITYTATPSFYLVSDNHTAFAMNSTIHYTCNKLRFNISTPIPFNSTGNIHLGSVVQYYRGDSAAMLLEGYDNTKELPNEPHLTQNPPLSSDVNLDVWKCFDEAIGDSIPLMQGEKFPRWLIAVCVLSAIAGSVLSCWALCKLGQRKARRNDPSSSDDGRTREAEQYDLAHLEPSGPWTYSDMGQGSRDNLI